MRPGLTKMFVFVAAALLFASCVNDEQYNATVDPSMTIFPDTRMPFSEVTPVFSADIVDFIGEETMAALEKYKIILSTGNEFQTDISLSGASAGLSFLDDKTVSFRSVILEVHAENSIPFSIYVTPTIPGGTMTINSSISQGTPDAPAKSDFIITVERQDGGINLDDINLHLLGRIEGEGQRYSLQRQSAISIYLDAITFVSGIDLNF